MAHPAVSGSPRPKQHLDQMSRPVPAEHGMAGSPWTGLAGGM
jgi:hypothetical protein